MIFDSFILKFLELKLEVCVFDVGLFFGLICVNFLEFSFIFLWVKFVIFDVCFEVIVILIGFVLNFYWLEC